MNTNIYALDSPITRKVYVPGRDEIPFAPVEYPKLSQEQDQTHRNMQWLFHKPQNAAIFPIEPQAVKIEKKK
jgi:hypothetical protein